MPPADIETASPGAKESSSGGGVEKLGYPPAAKGEDADAKWYVQTGAEGFRYCVYIQTSNTKEDRVCAVVITSTKDGKDPLAIARQRAKDALTEGYDSGLNSHRGWWQNFWQRSRVTVPDAAIQRQYDITEYLLGSGSAQRAAHAAPRRVDGGQWSIARRGRAIITTT